MTIRKIGAAGTVAAFLSALALAPPGLAAPDDAYAPLKIYDGAWKVVMGGSKASRLVNSCARTGLFFVCEQTVDGVPKGLVVYLPQGGGRYRTQTLRADGAAPGPWYALEIKGADWVYSPGTAKADGRTLNHIVDADHIHFDVQEKTGDGWKTTLSGDETRVK